MIKGIKENKLVVLSVCSVPLITDLKVACMFVEALKRHDAALKSGKPFWEIRSWDEYVVGL